MSQNGSPQWLGPPNGVHEVNGGGPVNYEPHMVQGETFFKPESVSSTQVSGDVEGATFAPQWSLGSQNFHAAGNHTDSSMNLGSPTEFDKNEKSKSKKPRARILTEREEAVMNKDDLELNDEELKIKKKAHNRLAQRAFRERKRTELKDLETKLLQSEEERQKLLKALQDIKRAKSDDNLRQTSTDPAGAVDFENSRFSFPSSQREFIDQMVDKNKHNVNPDTINKVYEQPENPGRKVLGVGAVWDYLQIKAEEEGYEGVDMYEVMQLLKGNEKCHGYGPAYQLELVNESLERVRCLLGR